MMLSKTPLSPPLSPNYYATNPSFSSHNAVPRLLRGEGRTRIKCARLCNAQRHTGQGNECPNYIHYYFYLLPTVEFKYP